MPPIVAPSNARSSGSHCPLRRELALSRASVHPGLDRGRQIAVRVDERDRQRRSCSTQVDGAGVRPQRSLVPPPRMTVGSCSRDAARQRRGQAAPVVGLDDERGRRHAIDRRRLEPCQLCESPVVRRSSEPLGEPGRFDRDAARYGPGHLAAQPRRRQHLAGIAEALRIEGVAHAAASRRGRRR